MCSVALHRPGSFRKGVLAMNKKWMGLFLSVLMCTGCASAPAEGNVPFDVTLPYAQSEELVLPALYGEGMVLQRGRVKITGRLNTDTDVAVLFNDKVYWGRAENGAFSIDVPDIAPGGPYSLTVRTKDIGQSFEKVYVGDVFLLGGQSNMSLTLGSCDRTLPIKYINEDIHLFTVGAAFADVPQTMLSGNWKEGNAAANMDFSAIGVIFADAMQKQENVPVGAVCASLGGTMTSTWIPEREAGEIENIPYVNPEHYANTSEPSKCFNGMIAPLADYAFKGVLWYQGENQSMRHQELLTGVISGWRRTFDDASLPFLIVELPGYEVKEDPTRWAQVRQAQQQTAEALENVWLCCTIDTGNRTEIHPVDKEIVALRCVQVGRNAFYGESLYTGPRITECKKENDTIVLTVAAEGGLNMRGDLEKCFEIRQKGGTSFKRAKVAVEGDTILLFGVKDPAQVRYCFTSFPSPAVFDSTGLPLDQYVSPAFD